MSDPRVVPDLLTLPPETIVQCINRECGKLCTALEATARYVRTGACGHCGSGLDFFKPASVATARKVITTHRRKLRGAK